MLKSSKKQLKKNLKRYPEKINIGGKDWKITYHNKSLNSSFVNYHIKIGIKQPEELLENLLHEILEAILVERGHRYSLYNAYFGNDGLLFSFNHNDFENIVKDLVSCLTDITKEVVI